MAGGRLTGNGLNRVFIGEVGCPVRSTLTRPSVHREEPADDRETYPPGVSYTGKHGVTKP